MVGHYGISVEYGTRRVQRNGKRSAEGMECVGRRGAGVWANGEEDGTGMGSSRVYGELKNVREEEL